MALIRGPGRDRLEWKLHREREKGSMCECVSVCVCICVTTEGERADSRREG